MKMYQYLFVLTAALAFSSCQKEKKNPPATEPVEFPGTTYQTLGTFDADGTPNYLAGRDNISDGMLDFIETTLVEQADLRTTRPDLLSNTAIADIAITQTSDVHITFVSQVTTASNAVAFYTYPTNKPPTTPKDIKTITYIFPNIGPSTKVKAGDKVKIGRFQPGTSIGFVLMKNAWDSTANQLNNKVVHFCSNDALNPERDPALKKHAVLVNYPAENKMLIGFENTDRTYANCDHDFNDSVLYATITQ
ncbi:MAG TPA: DUF4114 domain-containing protein [Chitinophagaceae bacterium]|jgi:hypothetical protein|nr:DUF4114 domain-containing protein [Chitinophagaceae bacterium]